MGDVTPLGSCQGPAAAALALAAAVLGPGTAWIALVPVPGAAALVARVDAAGIETPAVTTPDQARTDTTVEPGGKPARTAVHSGRPVVSWKAMTVVPNPTTATPWPTAA